MRDLLPVAREPWPADRATDLHGPTPYARWLRALVAHFGARTVALWDTAHVLRFGRWRNDLLKWRCNGLAFHTVAVDRLDPPVWGVYAGGRIRDGKFDGGEFLGHAPRLAVAVEMMRAACPPTPPPEWEFGAWLGRQRFTRL